MVVVISILIYILIGAIFFSDLAENLLPGDMINLIYYSLLSIFWPLTIIIFIFIVIVTFIFILFKKFLKSAKNK